MRSKRGEQGLDGDQHQDQDQGQAPGPMGPDCINP